ncbi:beta-sandwich domain of Sec23/24 [Macrolepiota fuliginosa MF-IS2]|uniref:Beta-sandwich domain of Sec23/24 n=1 Tax=Macrolepiota fuliginosa MF-IS2 TaxID=1400762 RepID=A0A9P5X3R5_9AGAR|nr:beta-sandwich domain of Sec23/24 [Macrolepiota fuliginosa MF-IS2]
MQNHIPQPPHTAGLGYQGLRPRIEPSQVPSPIETIETDRQAWEEKSYMTLPGAHVPLSTSEFAAVDQGNSSPRFIRVTTWNVPTSSRLASDCAIPLSVIVQPFADLDPREEEIPVVDFGQNGPERCGRCRGYVNPWCSWVAGGMRWRCNLCGHETEVSTAYFSNVDANMLRLDHAQRPELNRGTVDFVVSEEYWAQHPPPNINPSYFSAELPLTGPKQPLPMNYIFAFDVSNDAIERGFLKTSCDLLKTVLYGGTSLDGQQLDSSLPPASQVTILTYDRTLHFYDLNSDLTPMLVVADLDEVFVPMRDRLFVDPVGRRHAIEALLDALPQRFAQYPSRDSSLGSALRGILASLAGRGGHVILFQSTLPNTGLGALPNGSVEPELYDTDKEKTLHKPRDVSWLDVGEELAGEGIGVSMFLAPNKYMDIGSVGAVANQTGGELFFHPKFDFNRDAVALESQLQRVVRRYQGYNVKMKFRCSSGLRITKHYGNFVQSDPTDLDFGILDADKAIVADFEHSSSLNPREYTHIQCATLYTTVWGERRVRVINLALQVAEMAGNVFQYADMDAVFCRFAREAMVNMSKQKLSAIREELTEKCSAIMLGYRTKCAAASRTSQLIIPEAFKAFPAFLLGLLKSKPLKGRHVSSDVRNYTAHRILSLPPRDLIHSMYPRLLALHDLDEQVALPQIYTVDTPDPGVEGEVGVVHYDYGQIQMPSLMRNSHFFMEVSGIYLVDNEEILIFWVGSGVSPQLLQDLFGTDDFMSLDHRLHYLPRLQTTLSAQVHNILTKRMSSRGGRKPKIFVARQNHDAAEIEFSDMLVEDQNNGAMSYIDYLALIHKQITNVLNNGSALGGSASIRGSPW